MASIIRRILSCALLLVVLAARLMAQQAEIPTGKVLVLRNGRVLRGDVTRLGDRCIVVLTNGGQVQLPSRDISIEATSLEEAYQRMRDDLAAPDQVAGHLELASWCLQEGLHAQASDELIVATQIDPKDPRIDRLYRQLAYVKQPKKVPKKAASATKATDQPDPQELENVARAMPKQAVEEFTTSVQLLLLNRCGTTRCHDSRSATSFRLLRPANGDRFWRRMTLRNLYSTRAQIDSSNSDTSRLLQMAATPHGGLDVPVFEEGDAQFTALVRWVHHASQSAGSLVRAEHEQGAEEEPRRFAPGLDARPLGDAPLNDNDLPSADSQFAEDPFDPMIFNEQYSNRSASGED